MQCGFEAQLKVIAVVETVASAIFLGLNIKILIQLVMGQIDHNHMVDNKSQFNLSESALAMYFLIRVIYLLGEFLLAIFLTYNVYKRNVNGLILWFFMTIIFSIPSRCYFIGGVLWGRFFVATLLIFSANLAFTTYSLIIICLHVKHLTRYSGSIGGSSRRGSVAVNNNNENDTFLDVM